MNNWYLLLLALVAVFQPIASFTELNLIDGRQQCCDRQADTQLRDARSSFYETDRFTKTGDRSRRLNDRDEIRQERRFDLRERDIVLSRRSADRSFLDIRERESRRIPSNLVRSTRVQYSLERVARYVNGVRRDLQQTDRYVQQEEPSRRSLNRITRDSVMRQDDRFREVLERNAFSRDDDRVRVNRFSNTRVAKESDYQRDDVRAGSENFRDRTSTQIARNSNRRLTPTRDARDNLRRTREEAAMRVRISTSNDNRETVREGVNTVRREITSRVDARRYMDNNNERREQERNAEQRKALFSENSRDVERVRGMRLRENSRIVKRVRDMRVRENSRDERHENRNRDTSNQRLATERFEERRELAHDLRQSRENTDRRIVRERMQIDQRNIREAGLINDMSRTDRIILSRVDNRNNERQERHTRDNSALRERRAISRESRRVLSLERDSRVVERRARSLERRNTRDTREEIRRTQDAEVVRGHDGLRKQVEYRNKLENRERDTVDTRFRNVDNRNRDMMFSKVNNANEDTTSNWRYIFYTMQAAYLCALLIQISLPTCSEKSKKMSVCWWPVSSYGLIKVD